MDSHTVPLLDKIPTNEFIEKFLDEDQRTLLELHIKKTGKDVTFGDSRADRSDRRKSVNSGALLSRPTTSKARLVARSRPNSKVKTECTKDSVTVTARRPESKSRVSEEALDDAEDLETVLDVSGSFEL